MSKIASDKFGKTPYRLIDMYLDAKSGITADHICLYNVLWTKATWKPPPVETGYLSIPKLVEKLPYKKVHFYRLLKALMDEGFIERIYKDGKRRSSCIKIRFIDQNKGQKEQECDT